MSVGIKLTFMYLIDGGNTAISAEYDMVNKVGVTPNVANIALFRVTCKTMCQEDYQMLASKKPTGRRPAVRLRRLSPA